MFISLTSNNPSCEGTPKFGITKVTVAIWGFSGHGESSFWESCIKEKLDSSLHIVTQNGNSRKLQCADLVVSFYWTLRGTGEIISRSSSHG